MSWNDKEPRWHGDRQPAKNPAHFVINGVEYERVRYGGHADDLQFPKCDDCGVPRGSLHDIELRSGAMPALWWSSNHLRLFL